MSNDRISVSIIIAGALIMIGLIVHGCFMKSPRYVMKGEKFTGIAVLDTESGKCWLGGDDKPFVRPNAD